MVHILIKSYIFSQVIMDRLYKGVWEKVCSGSAVSQGLFQFAYFYKNRAIERGYEVPILNKYVP